MCIRDRYEVLLGVVAAQHLLKVLGLPRAKLLVIPDDGPHMVHRVASVARLLSPTTRILAKARLAADAHELTDGGVDQVIAEDTEALVGLFEHILREYQVAPALILDYEAAIREGNYAALDGDIAAAAAALACEIEAPEEATRTLTIRPESTAAEQALGDLDLESSGVQTVSVVQEGEVVTDPGADVVLHPGDKLTLSGPTEAFEALTPIFRGEA